ncbi:hypothetical protein HDU92_004701, partial [Lobulomyces angularis]
MVDLLYNFLLNILSGVLKLFFRQVKVRGNQQIPKRGAVIFCIAPHANQFIDPLVVMKYCGRKVSYLCAKKSFDRLLIGTLAKTFGAIPVERPQDLTKSGKGTIFSSDLSRKTIQGNKTKFTAELKPRSTIQLLNGVKFEVSEVLSDNLIILKNPFEENSLPEKEVDGVSYKIIPHVDQGEMFKTVYDSLHKEQAIGIFPEGGSHDRSEFLPLKPGFALMALGAMDMYPGLDVKIVPCGLNYFNPDRFRSRVVVEFGEPISVSAELVNLFHNGGSDKRLAVQTLLDQTHNRLKAIAVTAPDFETLMILQAARRLYRPVHKKLDIDQSLEITRKFGLGYSKFQSEPKVLELTRKVKDYNKLLYAFGIKDHQVKNMAIGGYWAFKTLIKRILLILIVAVASFPGFLLNGPIVKLVNDKSLEKAAEAKRESKVKIEGKDVIGSWKLIIGAVLFPAFYIFYTLIFGLYLKYLGHNYVFLKSLVFLFGFLPTIAVLTTLAYETELDIFQSLAPLVIASFSSSHQHESVRVMRSELQNLICEIIDEYGPKLENISKEDFNTRRIVKKKDVDYSKKINEDIKKNSLKAKDGWMNFENIFEWDMLEDKEEG